jgi:hypothetical protein
MGDTSDLDALVARNIGDIEAALEHARALGHALIEEIGELMRAELGEGWLVDVDVNDDTAPLRLARREWGSDETASAKGGYAFTFNENPGPGDETDNTWLSALLNAGPAGASIRLYFWSDSFGAKRRWRRLIQGQEAVTERLLHADFKQDSDQWLYLPLGLEAETLAQGYESGDLAVALKPAVDAARVIKSCLPAFDELIAADKTFE